MEDFNSGDFDCDNSIIQNTSFDNNTALLSETIHGTIRVVKGYLGANPMKNTSLINNHTII